MRSGSRHRVERILTANPLTWASLNLSFASLGGSALGATALLVAARLYTAADVGTGTALVYATSLLGTIGCLGFDSGLVRYLPEAGAAARSLVLRAVMISCLVSGLASVVFLSNTSMWGVHLAGVSTFLGGVVITGAVAMNALSMLLDGVLLTARRPLVVSARALGAGAMRIAGLVVFVSLGAWGVFGSWALALAIAVAAGALRLRGWNGESEQRTEVWRPPPTARVTRYSMKNLANDLAETVPASVMPLLVMGILGPQSVAYYALGALAGGVGIGVARAAATSLFAEGSHEQTRMSHLLRHSLRLSMLLVLPIVGCALVFTEPVLFLFGPEYATAGSWNLRLQVVSVIPATFVLAYFSVMRVRARLGYVFTVTMVGCLTTLVAAPILLTHMGVSGGGAAMLLGQTIMLAVVLPAIVQLLRFSIKTTEPLLSVANVRRATDRDNGVCLRATADQLRLPEGVRLEVLEDWPEHGGSGAIGAPTTED